jgi:hemoglobin
MARIHRGVALLVAMSVAVVGLGACATAKPAEPSLYKRLGGREGIKGVVDEFVAVLVADPRVNARFKDMKPPEVERLRTNAADQVCEAAGGPCSYLGKDMKAAHKGMKITEAEWSATVEDLVKAMDKKGVPKKEQQELLGLLGPMKADIVGQ